VHGLRFVLMEPNWGALSSAVQLEQTVKPSIYDGRQKFGAPGKLFRVSINVLCSPTAAVIESAFLMLLIGWIDYITDFNVTVFYFVPVVRPAMWPRLPARNRRL